MLCTLTDVQAACFAACEETDPNYRQVTDLTCRMALEFLRGNATRQTSGHQRWMRRHVAQTVTAEAQRCGFVGVIIAAEVIAWLVGKALDWLWNWYWNKPTEAAAVCAAMP